MSLTQIETIRVARLQLIDLGDEKTAALLDWALEDRATSAPASGAAPQREDPEAN